MLVKYIRSEQKAAGRGNLKNRLPSTDRTNGRSSDPNPVVVPDSSKLFRAGRLHWRFLAAKTLD